MKKFTDKEKQVLIHICCDAIWRAIPVQKMSDYLKTDANKLKVTMFEVDILNPLYMIRHFNQPTEFLLDENDKQWLEYQINDLLELENDLLELKFGLKPILCKDYKEFLQGIKCKLMK